MQVEVPGPRMNNHRVGGARLFGLESILGLALWIFAASEALGGALRYYSEGSYVVAYGPKVFLLVCVGLVAFRRGVRVEMLWCLAALLYAGSVALFHSGDGLSIGTALFFLAPFFFGLALSGELDLVNQRKLWWMIAAVCALGLVADMTGELPWKGYAYQVGDVELVASREWNQFGVDRPAGFTRISTTLAVMAGISGLLLLRGRLRALDPVILVASGVVIYLTTYKTAVPALVMGYATFAIARKWKSVYALLSLVLLCFPFVAVALDFGLATDQSVLTSLYERFARTWPQFVEAVGHLGSPVFGAGLGMVGTASKFSAVARSELTAVSDNTVLYLWGAMGIFGLIVFALGGAVMIRLASLRTERSKVLLAVFAFIVVLSSTTDVFESPLAQMMIGYSIGMVCMRLRSHAVR